MPSPLFDYIPESFHTMGASPQPSQTEVLCKNGTWDITFGFAPPCRTQGGEATPRKVRPYAPPYMPPPLPAPAPIPYETVTCPDGFKFTHPKDTRYFMDPCTGHYCPQVRAPICRPDQMLRTTYGPAPCKTPNYSCGPRR